VSGDAFEQKWRHEQDEITRHYDGIDPGEVRAMRDALGRIEAKAAHPKLPYVPPVGIADLTVRAEAAVQRLEDERDAFKGRAEGYVALEMHAGWLERVLALVVANHTGLIELSDAEIEEEEGLELRAERGPEGDGWILNATIPGEKT
jgi:hypothetical protein